MARAGCAPVSGMAAASARTAGLGLALGICSMLCAAGVQAADPPMQVAGLPADLTLLSLDDLLAIEVTSVSKHAEPLGRAAAAIYVVTGDEIQRAGARTIAEALRLVPGMTVARTNASAYTITARGFTDKLQVLLDGRSVYTPLTSTVFWDVLDTFLPDIDRIEVIRGPGATLWGANAVNGVINIITKSAADTHGGELVAGGGTEERAFSALRTGTAVAQAGHVRFYAKGFERDNAMLASGSAAMDGQRHLQGGLRSDWSPGANQDLMVAGDIYSGREHGKSPSSAAAVETQLSGGNLNSRWSMLTGAQGELSATLSYDRYKRDIPEVFEEARDTYDVGLQHQLDVGGRQQLTYGLSYRNSRDQTLGPPTVLLFEDPPARTLQTYGAFAQDQIHFADAAVIWTVGSKFEHNSFTGFEWQPGTRVGWQINPDWFAWSGVSRAVRTPNRLNSDLAFFCAAPFDVTLGCTLGTSSQLGNPSLRAEKLIAYESGLRYSGSRNWSVDLATFYNDYTDLVSLEKTGPSALQVRYGNQLRGKSSGAEVSVNWKPAAQLDLRGFYSFLNLDIRAEPGSTDASTANTDEGSSPRHQAGLRAGYQMAQRWRTDAFLHYSGKLRQSATPSSTTGSTSVPAYTELNLRTAYRPWPALELALYGENLLHPRHAEFGAANTRSELERAVLFQVNWVWP